MKENFEVLGITLRHEPIENPGTIGVVEIYYAHIRWEYERVRSHLDNTDTDDDCLGIENLAFNATVDPEGLCYMLLVFGTFLRPEHRSTSPTQIELGRTIEQAITVAEKSRPNAALDWYLVTYLVQIVRTFHST